MNAIDGRDEKVAGSAENGEWRTHSTIANKRARWARRMESEAKGGIGWNDLEEKPQEKVRNSELCDRRDGGAWSHFQGERWEGEVVRKRGRRIVRDWDRRREDESGRGVMF
jgi:hypothetical protein